MFHQTAYKGKTFYLSYVTLQIHNFELFFSSEGTQLFWALHNVRVECKHVLSQHIAQKIQSKSRNTFMIDKHVIFLFNQMHLRESETKRYKHLVSKTIERKGIMCKIQFMCAYNLCSTFTRKNVFLQLHNPQKDIHVIFAFDID